MKKYYLLAFANFLAAISGGAILSSGLKSFEGTLPKAPILAFFAGIVIGLIFQMLVPERRARSVAPWFSVAAGPVSLALVVIFRANAVGGVLTGAAMYFFLAVLSVRYGLWFFSRALRAQSAGAERQGIPLIELGYYSGMVLGLIVERGAYGLENALFVDALLLPLAGLIDIANARGHKALENAPDDSRQAGETPRAAVVDKLPFDYVWYWRLTAAVVCLTIGFQGVIFSIKHPTPERTASAMAWFYASVALSALFCKAFQIKFDWGALGGRVTGNATVSSERTDRLKANFGLMTLAAAASLLAALMGGALVKNAVLLELLFIATAAFIYQILVLSLLDNIGRAEKFSRLNERVKITYLILGIGTVLSILLLSYYRDNNNKAAGVVVTVACSLISFYAVRRRAVAHA